MKSTLLVDRKVLEGQDFSRTRFAQFTAIASSFASCSFRGASFDQACFGGGISQSRYFDCCFDGSRITAVAPGNARFERCSFRNCRIREMFATMVEFVDCAFSGRFLGGVLHGRPPLDRDVGRTVNEFRGNDFTGMELRDVDFRSGVDLRLQQLPSGPSYVYIEDPEHALTRARAAVVTWKDLDLRRKALAILKSLEMDVEDGQRQLFYCAGASTNAMRGAAESLIPLLRQDGA